MSFYMQRHVEREILSALIDGELSAEERRFVHEHLQECAECRETAEEFTQIHGMMGGLPRLVAPETFVADVLQPPRRAPGMEIASRAMSGRRRWAALGLAAAAAAITLAGLAVPPPADEPPVDVFIERHVSVHSGVEPGAQVLLSVNGR
jgi:anti-sigma factor RsiW